MKNRVLKIKFLIISEFKHKIMLLGHLSKSKVYALIPIILAGLVALTFGLAYAFLPFDNSVVLTESMKITDTITVIKNGG